ncbi:Plasminogen, partial [Stegodyphus mimosarum]
MATALFTILVIFSVLKGNFCDDDDQSSIYCPKPFHYDVLINSTGHIYNPLYDKGEYPSDITCYYKFRLPENYRIRFTFKDLDIDPSDFCQQDSLTVAIEFGIEIPIGLFCGSEIPRPVILEEGSELVQLTFMSDYMGSGRGFHIYYEASPFLEICPPEHIVCRNRKCVAEGKQCDGEDDCEDGTDEEECDLPIVISNECGNTPIKPKTFDSSDRIVGGEEAIPHSWPWQVSLQDVIVEPSGHSCGGTLINSQWVLTAAHCFLDNAEPSMFRLHLGAHHKYNKAKGEQIRYAEKIIGFPDLEDDELANKVEILKDDIALVKLNAPVKFTDTVQPACLPNLGWKLKPGTRCFVTGWGETRGTGHSTVLKQTPVTVISTKNCTYDPRHQICVDQPKSSACHGDSGGPLACQVESKWFVMGDTSFTTADNFESGLCALPQNKVVFSKVADKADWIKVMIDAHS